MAISRQIHFDLYLARVKAQSKHRAFEILAEEASPLAMTSCDELINVFEKRMSERNAGVGGGVAVFDVKSPYIQKPVTALVTLDQAVEYGASDHAPVDVIAAVLSPLSFGPKHLQKLAGVSRLMRSDDLCEAMREAKDIDALRVLFMPNQGWMVAAA